MTSDKLGDLITEWYKKSLKDFDLADLATLRLIIEDILPAEVDVKVNVDGKEYNRIGDYVTERINNFFDVTHEDFEKIVGKCFKNKYKVIKVLALSDKHDENFLYEEYEIWSNGSCHNKDYIWLQEMVYGDFPHKEYEKYCLTPHTEMNIFSEDMYQLGKDGKLYVDITCGGNYEAFSEVKESIFEICKAEAIENDGEYKVYSHKC